MTRFENLSRFAFSALVLSALLGPALASAQQTQAAGPTLYQRLGGYDAIAAVTDDFIGQLATDSTEKKFFVGLGDDSKARIRQHVVDQLCAATGGPCIYLGRDMKTAHKGLNITEDDWKIAVNDLTASLNKFKVGQREQSELLGALTKIKPDIVTGPAK